MKRWFWLIGLLLNTPSLEGQTELVLESFNHVKRTKGAGPIYAIQKDSRGFMVFGGVESYDRLRIGVDIFKKHKTDGAITDIIEVDSTMFLCDGHLGTVDIISPNGITKRAFLPCTRNTRHFVEVKYEGDAAIMGSCGGRIHILRANGQSISLSDTLGWVREFERFDENNAIAVSRKGSFLINLQTFELESVDLGVNTDSVTAIAFGYGKSIVACGQHVFEIENRSIGKKHFVPLGLNNAAVNLLVDENGRIWVGGYHEGLFFIEEDLIVDSKDYFNIENNLRVNGMYLDLEGSIWISDYALGVHTIKQLDHEVISELDGLFGSVYDIELEPGNGLWIATSKGLYNWNKKKLSWVNIDEDRMRFQSPNSVDIRGAIGIIYRIKYSQGSNRGLFGAMAFYKLSKPQPILLKEKDRNYIFLGAAHLNWTGENQFIVSDHLEAKKFRLENGEMLSMPLAKSSKFPRSNQFEDSRGRVWYSEKNRFLGVGREGEDYKPFDETKLNKRIKSILKSGVKTFFEDNEGGVWLGTISGLVRYYDEKWTAYYLKDKKVDIGVNALNQDKEGRLWVAAKDGLHSLSVKNKSGFLNYSIISDFDGVNVRAMDYDSSKNLLLVAVADAIHIYDLANLKISQKQIPDVSILELEDINVRSHHFPKNVSLPKTSRNFRIHFESPYYTDPEKIVYEYSDQSANGPWFSTTDNKVEQMTASYGKHEFHVRAKVGDATSKVSSLYYTIETPFFLRTWVQVAGVFLVILIVILLALQRIKNVKQRESKERNMLLQLKVLEQQALGAMMNPHFVYNSLASIQNYFTRTNNLQASEHVAELGQLIRMNMDAASGSFIRLSVELDRLKLYLKLEQQRMAQPFEFDVQVDSEVEMHRYFVPSMVIQPFLENALIHGIWPLENKKGQIEMAITLGTKETIQVTILDNGIGFSTSQKKKSSQRISRGLQITRDRLGLLEYVEGDSITVEDRVSENGEIIGTKATLILPLKREDEMTDTN